MYKRFVLFKIVLLLAVSTVSAGIEPWTGMTNTVQTKMKYFMHTGYMFDAVLQTAIFSYNIESPVIAEIEYDVIYLDKIILPKHSKIIGYASILKSDDRVNIFFHTTVFPNGQELKINALTLNTDGSLGIPGVVKKYQEILPAKILLETAANIAVPGIAKPIIKELTADSARDLSYKPTYSVTVKKGTPVVVYIVDRVEY
ncbi:MAG: TrbI/VirB10 family protein [Elusimicrobiota bacterium]